MPARPRGWRRASLVSKARSWADAVTGAAAPTVFSRLGGSSGSLYGDLGAQVRGTIGFHSDRQVVLRGGDHDFSGPANAAGQCPSGKNRSPGYMFPCMAPLYGDPLALV